MTPQGLLSTLWKNTRAGRDGLLVQKVFHCLRLAGLPSDSNEVSLSRGRRIRTLVTFFSAFTVYAHFTVFAFTTMASSAGGMGDVQLLDSCFWDVTWISHTGRVRDVQESGRRDKSVGRLKRRVKIRFYVCEGLWELVPKELFYTGVYVYTSMSCCHLRLRSNWMLTLSVSLHH